MSCPTHQIILTASILCILFNLLLAFIFGSSRLRYVSLALLLCFSLSLLLTYFLHTNKNIIQIILNFSEIKDTCKTLEYMFFLLIVSWDSIILLFYFMTTPMWPRAYLLYERREKQKQNKIQKKNKIQKNTQILSQQTEIYQFNWTDYLEKQENNTSQTKNNHAFVIAAHNSSDKLRNTISLILRLQPPYKIFIADNGSTQEEQKLTKQLCEELTLDYARDHPGYKDPGLNYGNMTVGNKTIAQFASCFSLLLYPIAFEYVTFIDDDCAIPNDWNEDEVIAYFDEDEDVGCVAYPVVPTTTNKILNSFQSVEYKIASYIRVCQANISSTVFGSGAWNTWKISIVLDLLLRHDCMFNGEDLQLGLLLHTVTKQPLLLEENKYHLSRPYKIAVCTTMIIETDAPKCFIHKKDILNCACVNNYSCTCGEPSLFKQRALGWELSRHRFFFKWLKPLFYCHNWTWRGCWIKLITSYDAILIINDWVSLGYMIYLAFIVQNWILIIHGVILAWGLSLISLVPLNYLVFNKAKLNISYDVLILFVVMYKIPMLLFVKTYGMFYNILWYTPCVRSKEILHERLIIEKDLVNIAKNSYNIKYVKDAFEKKYEEKFKHEENKENTQLLIPPLDVGSNNIVYEHIDYTIGLNVYNNMKKNNIKDINNENNENYEDNDITPAIIDIDLNITPVSQTTPMRWNISSSFMPSPKVKQLVDRQLTPQPKLKNNNYNNCNLAKTL